MKIITLVILLKVYNLKPKQPRPFIFDMTHEDPVHETTAEFYKNPHKNNFQITFENKELMQNNKLYLIFESENPDFLLSLLKPNSKKAT